MPLQSYAEPRAAAATPSQKIKVTGVVEDAEGPVIGASVIEKGTGNGTLTDLDGNFTLMVSPGATLKISFVGNEPVEVKATEAPMKITLEQSSQMLSEVVVTALGI
ncbi:carboxypeptidase-like regulatory domain-containing protein, partial [Muribaculum intestinale]|uniref:carboxypeptidase-like regulatory domain-containing protein n=2 Tax=Muribaculaceae TaxID=2005473 RepID=UPI0025B1ABB5